MRAVCPWARVLVMLRNPVERAYSQYQMCADPEGTPEQLKVRGESAYKGMTFRQVVDQEIAQLTGAGVAPGCSFEVFRSGVLSRAPLTHGGHSIVARGLYVLQLRRWMQQWPAEQLAVHSLSELKGPRAQVQATMERVFAFLDVPSHDIGDLEAKNTRKYAPMPEDCREKLAAFYAPFNAELFELLGRELVW
jgi:hypothetical protein